MVSVCASARVHIFVCRNNVYLTLHQVLKLRVCVCVCREVVDSFASIGCGVITARQCLSLFIGPSLTRVVSPAFCQPDGDTPSSLLCSSLCISVFWLLTAMLKNRVE